MKEVVNVNFIVSATTDIGLTKNTNQDSYCAKVYNTTQGKIVMAVLCDGMGGLSKGEMASATLIHAFSKWADDRLLFHCDSGFQNVRIGNEWTDIVIEYNEKIKNYGKMYGVSMGTTIVAMLLTETRYYILNVGDSRAYELTNEAIVLTKDQTVVSKEIELGRMTEEEAEKDARRSVLLQCVGASDTVVPDMFFGETKLNVTYMLCSDGFRHEITIEEIYQYLNPAVMLNEDGMKQNMESLVEINKQRQERDNISVVTVRTF